MKSKLIPVLLLVPGLFAARGMFAADTASGITEPVLHVTLSASVPGIVSARRFKEGDTVKQGEVIVELDKQLEEIETARRKLIAEQKKQDYDSTAVLFEKTKSVAREELLRKESEYKVAAAEYDIAAEQLRRRLITAPFAGRITEINLEVGEACQSYQPLVRLVDNSRCYFVANVEAGLAARLKQDAAVKLEVETGASPAGVQAKIIFISPVVDPASGLVKVRALFDNADGRVRPGLAAKMILD